MSKMIIAKEGGSVSDSVKNQAFNSDKDCLKVKINGKTTTDSSGNLTITHNLGYYPAFIAFSASGSTWEVETRCYSTTTLLVFKCGSQKTVYYDIFSTAI